MAKEDIINEMEAIEALMTRYGIVHVEEAMEILQRIARGNRKSPEGVRVGDRIGYRNPDYMIGVVDKVRLYCMRELHVRTYDGKKEEWIRRCDVTSILERKKQ